MLTSPEPMVLDSDQSNLLTFSWPAQTDLTISGVSKIPENIVSNSIFSAPYHLPIPVPPILEDEFFAHMRYICIW